MTKDKVREKILDIYYGQVAQQMGKPEWQQLDSMQILLFCLEFERQFHRMPPMKVWSQPDCIEQLLACAMQTDVT